jgi:nucleotide-binding universal stress UspA family protein
MYRIVVGVDGSDGGRLALRWAVHEASTRGAAVVGAARAARGLCAAARDADLLVLGGHGHSRVWHTVLGSVSEECVRDATCPVVVVPSARPAPARTAEPAVPAGR